MLCLNLRPLPWVLKLQHLAWSFLYSITHLKAQERRLEFHFHSVFSIIFMQNKKDFVVFAQYYVDNSVLLAWASVFPITRTCFLPPMAKMSPAEGSFSLHHHKSLSSVFIWPGCNNSVFLMQLAWISRAEAWTFFFFRCTRLVHVQGRHRPCLC